MLNLDEDAVICDLAETYQVYNYRSLPLHLVATFVCGLGQNSRIKKKISNEEFTTTELLLMKISDCLQLLVWQNTADGMKGKNRPTLLSERLFNSKKTTSLGFNSIEEFELTRQAIIRGGNNG